MSNPESVICSVVNDDKGIYKFVHTDVITTCEIELFIYSEIPRYLSKQKVFLLAVPVPCYRVHSMLGRVLWIVPGIRWGPGKETFSISQ